MNLQLLSNFARGAAFVANTAALLIGAAFALLLTIAGLLILASFAGWAFDRLTAWVATRWIADGVQPKGRIARVIHACAIRDG